MEKEKRERLFLRLGQYILFGDNCFDNMTGEQVRKIKEFLEKELIEINPTSSQPEEKIK